MANWFAAGGVVMYPLVIFAGATGAIAWERARFWWQVQRNQPRAIRESLLLYRQSPAGALSRLRAQRGLPVVQMFLAALELENPTPEEFRLALESAAQGLLPNLKRFSTALETIVNLAPLLGLLGTILGLMTSFANLNWEDLGASSGTTSGSGVATGLSEALVSTAAGLVVAIAALLVANTLRSLYRRQIAYLAECGGQLELLYRRRFELTTLPFEERV